MECPYARVCKAYESGILLCDSYSQMCSQRKEFDIKIGVEEERALACAFPEKNIEAKLGELNG